MGFPTKKSISVAILFATATIALWGCDDEPAINIGFIGGLSGRSADIGQASRNAVQLAIDEKNAQGGIHGRKIILLPRDDENNPDVAEKHVRELAALGVDAIIGPNISAIAGGMLPAIVETDILTISPTVSSLFFIGKDDPFFRMSSSARQNASAYATNLFAKGKRRISIAFGIQNRLFTESWLREFQAAFEALGGAVVATTPYDPKGPDGYAAVVPPLLAASPDAVLLISNGLDTAQIAQQFRKAGSTVKLIAAEWAASEQLIELGGKAVEGLTILQAYDRENLDPRYLAFRDTYRDRFINSPGFSSIAAYDAASLIFAALERRAAGGGLTLKEALFEVVPMQGLQQILTFDQYGDGERMKFFVTIKNGDFVGE